MISQKTLFLSEDRENVVEEGDPKAKFLLVRAGQELSDALAEKYGISAGKAKAPTPAPSAPVLPAQKIEVPKPKAKKKPRK